jgi:hypothetical protein
MRAVLASVVLFLACSGSDDSTPSGTGGAGGAPACWDVATACPSTPPYEGARCAVADTCSYSKSLYEYHCVGERWGAVCVGAGGGSSCVPPFSETCDSPSSGPVSGITLELGDGDASQPFVPWADGATVDAVWGGQGSPMLAYRLRVTGAEVSDCALVAHKLSLGTFQGPETKRPVRLHCGESLVLYDILPLDQACDQPPPPTDVTLEVTVFGHTKAVKLTWPTAACPLGGGFG